MLRGKYVVVGAGGFVGKALTLKLLQQGCDVVALSRGTYPDLEEAGANCFKVDISTPPDVWCELFLRAQGVFHTAAKVDMWGRREDFVRVNVDGTAHVIEACNFAKVPALVFTSSPSVIADGKDLVGVDESYPYPQHYEAFYPETKAIAERAVRNADGSTLRTVSLRPHLIWGPGDTHLIPTIVERARQGKLKQIGDGKNLVDLTFIDDCIVAHILAMQKLQESPDKVGGKVYFISQGDPVPLWDWINSILEIHQIAPVTKKVSVKIANAVAILAENITKLFSYIGVDHKPLFTRFLVGEMATTHYFNIGAATRELGYIPSASTNTLVKAYQV